MMLLPSIAIIGDSIGSGEILVILLAALIVFGPNKLPTFARTLGRLLSDLRRSAREFADELARAGSDTQSSERAQSTRSPSSPDALPKTSRDHTRANP